jgi:TatD DNase family protein
LLADTHCHLDFVSFNEDRDSVIQCAEAQGVVRILNPGIDLESSHRAIDLASKNSSVYAAVGFHPNEGQVWQEDSLEELKTLARSEKVVAIGEIGLDYYRDKTDRDLQWRIFRVQLDIAAEAGLPVIIHSRDKPGESSSAISDVLYALEHWRAGLKNKNPELYHQPGVLHSFSGDIRDAKRAIENGFFIGISGPVTFKKADVLKDVVSSVPAEYLLSETDAPFLTPHPYRGKRNEPGYVRFVATEIANLRGQDFLQISEIMFCNAKRLFHW